jgi:hypothetical protein
MSSPQNTSGCRDSLLIERKRVVADGERQIGALLHVPGEERAGEFGFKVALKESF